jgi:hypothetical protein
MKRTGIVRGGICLAVFCLMALHCANPFLPGIGITPEDGTVFVADAVTTPYPVDVTVSVPVPGCGATVYPVNPATFVAELIPVLDGVLGTAIDVTGDLGSPVEDPDTGTLTWTGTVGVANFGNHILAATISNDQGPSTRTRNFRLEQTASLLPGPSNQRMTVSSLGQDPSGCMIPQALMLIINPLLSTAYFDIYGFPSGAELLAAGSTGVDVLMPLPPPLPTITVNMVLDEVNNDIIMNGPGEMIIDMTGLAPGLPFDCVITGNAGPGAGVFDDLDPNDLDGTLVVSITDVQASPGGTCSLTPPAGACEMIVRMDADPI